MVDPFGSCAMAAVWPRTWRVDGKPAHDYSVQQLGPGCDFSDRRPFGLFTLSGDNAFAGRRPRVEGYPGDKSNGSRWKMAGEVDRNSVNYLYPDGHLPGAGGSPAVQVEPPVLRRPCNAGVHAYGASGTPPMNNGPMLTAGRIQHHPRGRGAERRLTRGRGA